MLEDGVQQMVSVFRSRKISGTSRILLQFFTIFSAFSRKYRPSSVAVRPEGVRMNTA